VGGGNDQSALDGTKKIQWFGDLHLLESLERKK